MYHSTMSLVAAGRTAIPALSMALGRIDEEEGELSLVFFALEECARDAIPFLRDLLQHPKAVVRGRAASCLESLGALARGALRELVLALEDPDESVPWRAALALGQIDSPISVSALARAAVDPRDTVSGQARVSLVGVQGSAVMHCVPILQKALRSENRARRALAAEAADEFAWTERGWRVVVPLIDDLVGLLDESNEDACLYAASAISFVGPRAKRAIPRLVELFSANSRDAQAEASHALAAMGRVAVPALRTELKSDDVRHRENAAYALGQIGSRAKSALPLLLERLARDPSARVRKAAALSIGSIGHSPLTCLPLLHHALEDRAKEVRIEAVAGLGSFGEIGVPFLVDALIHDREEVRIAAVGLLGQFGSKARGAVPALIRILESEPNATTRGLAIATLGKIGPAAVAAVPLLLRRASSGGWHTRRWAFEALGKIEATQAVPVLTKALEGPNELVVHEARRALVRIGEGRVSSQR
ncbi:MAG: HEAT repeat domain-containing protein [Planctomycetota bacterium]